MFFFYFRCCFALVVVQCRTQPQVVWLSSFFFLLLLLCEYASKQWNVLHGTTILDPFVLIQFTCNELISKIEKNLYEKHIYQLNRRTTKFLHFPQRDVILFAYCIYIFDSFTQMHEQRRWETNKNWKPLRCCRLKHWLYKQRFSLTHWSINTIIYDTKKTVFLLE